MVAKSSQTCTYFCSKIRYEAIYRLHLLHPKWKVLYLMHYTHLYCKDKLYWFILALVTLTLNYTVLIHLLHKSLLVETLFIETIHTANLVTWLLALSAPETGRCELEKGFHGVVFLFHWCFVNSRLGLPVSGCEGTTAVTHLPTSYAGAKKQRPEVSRTHTCCGLNVCVPCFPVHMLRPNAHSVIVFRGGPFWKVISVFIKPIWAWDLA